MTRYYYTCPIKAAYMAKEFGVRYNVKVKGGSEWVTFRPYDMTVSKYVDQVRTNFYVAKESEEIFKQKPDDFVWYKRKYSFSNVVKINKEESDMTWNEDFEYKIIMRDNKQFFEAEKEND